MLLLLKTPVSKTKNMLIHLLAFSVFSIVRLNIGFRSCIRPIRLFCLFIVSTKVLSYESEVAFCSRFSTGFSEKLPKPVTDKHLDIEITRIALYTTEKLEALSNRYTYQMQKKDERIEQIFRHTAKAKNAILKRFTSPGNADFVAQLKGIISSVKRNKWLPQHIEQVHETCAGIVEINRMIAGREWYNVRKFPCQDWNLKPYPGFCIFSLKHNSYDNVAGTSDILGDIMANVKQQLSNELADVEHSFKWCFPNEVNQKMLMQNAQNVQVNMVRRLDRIQQNGYEDVNERFSEYTAAIYAVGDKAFDELNAFIFAITF